MTRIVDLSFTIESSPQDLPEFMRIDVSYTDHAHGAGELEQLTGAPRRLLRNEEGPAGERLSLGHARDARTSMLRGTTTARSAASRRRRSTSCRSTGSSAPASSSTCARRPTATP